MRITCDSDCGKCVLPGGKTREVDDDYFESYFCEKCANALCRIWKKDHFTVVTQDLWEERFCFPDLKENFSYSLAACSRGLFCANKVIKNPKWKKTAMEM